VSAAPRTEPPADLSHLRLSLQTKWNGFDSPLYVTNAGDGSGRLFVLEQPGTIRVIRDDRVGQTPYLDVSGLISTGGERGLLGLAFAPDFKHNGHVYIDYTDISGNTVVARYTAPDPASDTPTWSAPQTVLAITQPYANHNGGCLQFGPDRMLYIGMGDGGSAGDPGNRAQNPAVLLGKMLRLDVEGPTTGKPYAIPTGQPLQPGWAPEVWMIGLRNPWRFSFDASGGAMWIGDVGQDAWEEIDVAPTGQGGQNWGWHVWEGNHPYPPGSSPSKAGFSFPFFDYPHPKGESVTGGYVYRGTKYPALVGTYLFADFVNGWVAGIRTTTPTGEPLPVAEERTLLETSIRIPSFGVDEVGEVYLVDYSGTVLAVSGTAR
jgi:glucose/arabinose dehydrogenase